jgi:hypothetical protein
MQNWAVVVPLLILVGVLIGVVAWRARLEDAAEFRAVSAENQALRAHLALAKDQNLAGVKVIHKLRSELAELRKRMDEKESVIGCSRVAE